MQFPTLEVFSRECSFSIGSGTVFVNKQASEGAPFPPSEGYFLLLDGTPMLLLDGEFLALL